MGIPHLITHLTPYADAVVQKNSKTVDTDTDVDSTRITKAIIDGPGFAYHIYYRCLSLRPQARNPFEAAPSYDEIGRAATAWLDELCSHEIEICRIFFDGFLPVWKRDVRASRLQSNLNQLIVYKSFHPTSPSSAHAPLPLALSAEALFSAPSAPSRLTSLPACAFLVPAVIEALLKSPYGHLVQLVPGEADVYCALLTREEQTRGSTILTGDSDLLVHPLSSHASVVFFKDVSLPDGHDGPLQSLLFRPAATAQSLGLPDLSYLAFCLKRDSTAGFRECIRKAKVAEQERKYGEGYQEFLKEYAIEADTPFPMSCPSTKGGTVSRLVQQLDPRISEFVLQLHPGLGYPPALTSSTPQSDENAHDKIDPAKEINIYLPFLLDDPTRASAWEAGLPLRTLAYSLFLSLSPSTAETTTDPASRLSETSRRGQNIATRLIQSLDQNAISSASANLLSTLQHLSSTLASTSPSPPPPTRTTSSPQDLYRAYALHATTAWYTQTSRPPPSRTSLKALVTSPSSSSSSSSARTSTNTPKTWPDIHLDAQMQAVLYSLRLLRQLTTLLMAMSRAGYGNVAPTANLVALETRLRDLPDLSSLSGSLSFSSSSDAAASDDAEGIEGTQGTVPTKKEPNLSTKAIQTNPKPTSSASASASTVPLTSPSPSPSTSAEKAWDTIIDAIFHTLEIESASTSTSSSTTTPSEAAVPETATNPSTSRTQRKRKWKRKRERETKTETKRDASPRSSNPYALLDYSGSDSG
ncbi:MAG: hypothetical protein M1819_001656 [Sarea resinae]|nr:MAG: hypothetical protein M1819_001656 [Sarea resinae]